ncbi:rubrerythrin family protein, partial [Candidatus Gracilibacteria bacterium]|nr:rubrerythrin family protein [Candidatus Gracilibacteria bacterium]
MNNTKINPTLLKKIYLAQKSEITEFHVYSRLAKFMKGKNKEILQKIANEEKSHAQFWQTYSQKDIKPSQWKVFKFFWIARILGFTFAIKLMERGEESAQINYKEMSKDIPGAKKLVDEEEEHEKQLIELLNEERLDYIDSIVLGLNDALVDLTGA